MGVSLSFPLPLSLFVCAGVCVGGICAAISSSSFVGASFLAPRSVLRWVRQWALSESSGAERGAGGEEEMSCSGAFLAKRRLWKKARFQTAAGAAAPQPSRGRLSLKAEIPERSLPSWARGPHSPKHSDPRSRLPGPPAPSPCCPPTWPAGLAATLSRPGWASDGLPCVAKRWMDLEGVRRGAAADPNGFACVLFPGCSAETRLGSLI